MVCHWAAGCIQPRQVNALDMSLFCQMITFTFTLLLAAAAASSRGLFGMSVVVVGGGATIGWCDDMAGLVLLLSILAALSLLLSAVPLISSPPAAVCRLSS